MPTAATTDPSIVTALHPYLLTRTLARGPENQISALCYYMKIVINFVMKFKNRYRNDVIVRIDVAVTQRCNVIFEHSGSFKSVEELIASYR